MPALIVVDLCFGDHCFTLVDDDLWNQIKNLPHDNRRTDTIMWLTEEHPRKT